MMPRMNGRRPKAPSTWSPGDAEVRRGASEAIEPS
jgi:hypothetical protein